MLCLGLSGCQQQPSALDYFLAALVVVTAIAAARLLACAVARCLFADHHHHHGPSTSDDFDEGPWGAAGLPIFGPLGHGHAATECRSSLVLAAGAGMELARHVAHRSPLTLG